MTQQICKNTGEAFDVSVLEQKLRGVFEQEGLPTTSQIERFKYLGAFWQQLHFHNRTCDLTGKKLISVFGKDCVYPVWNRDEWINKANPPSIDFDESSAVFPQMWSVFRQSPIPHNFQSRNENCEYADDWYLSKNCYLCHGGQNNEDSRYCYGCDSLKDNYWSSFSFDSELCADLINSKKCFDSFYLLNCQNIQNSAFLYDCRNCVDCLFCSNLRNKKYCFGNQQLTKEAFEKKKQEWDFASRKVYDKAKKFFAQMMNGMAWHRALQIDHSENSAGNYLNYTKDCENSYLITKHEEAVNVVFSGPGAKTLLDCFGTVGAEKAYSCVLPVYCYETKFCFSVDNSRFCDYSAFLKNCEHCFGCCGLVNVKYHIFNKAYAPEEYHKLREKIINKMKKTGEYGQFFPKYFAATPYEESLSGFHWPLSKEDQKAAGFNISTQKPREKQASYKDISQIPDSSSNIPADLSSQVFWDEKAQRLFQIQAADIKFCQKLKIPLSNSFYVERIKENFKWMFFSGTLRETVCAKSAQKIKTYWPAAYDARIISEEEYLKLIN